MPERPDARPVRARTASVEATRDLAGALAGVVRAGDVIVLAGELGAGKTAFAQGFGAALGVEGPVVSPTFAIARQYEGGRLPLHHLDVYRLEHLHEALDLGLSEALDEGAVALVEWGDAIVGVLGPDYLEVRITFGPGDEEREVHALAVGDRWEARAEVLATVLGPWRCDEEGEPPC